MASTRIVLNEINILRQNFRKKIKSRLKSIGTESKLDMRTLGLPAL